MSGIGGCGGFHPVGSSGGGGGVPSFRISSYQQFTSTHTPSLSVPAGAAVGDFFIVWVFTNDTSISAGPTGFNTVVAPFTPGGGGGTNAIYARTLTAGQPGSSIGGFTSAGSTGFGAFMGSIYFKPSVVNVGANAKTTLSGQSPVLPSVVAPGVAMLLGFIQANGAGITVPTTMQARVNTNESNFSNLFMCLAETFVPAGSIPTETFVLALPPSQFEAQVSVLLA